MNENQQIFILECQKSPIISVFAAGCCVGDG